MDVNGAALVPGCEHKTAVAAVVLDILQRVDHIGNEAEAQGETEGDEGPDAVNVEVSTDKTAIGWGEREEEIKTHWVVFPA